MSRYKDRYGQRINEGDVVALMISVNFESFKGFTFAVTVCKRKGRYLVLDGVYGFCLLKDLSSRELAKITPETDLWSVNADFSRERKKYDR